MDSNNVHKMVFFLKMDKVDDDQTNFDFVPHILAIQSLWAISLALELFLHEMKQTFVQPI